MKGRRDIDVQSFRDRLTARRDELLRVRESAGNPHRLAEVDETQTGHLSRIEVLQDQAMAIGAGRRREAEIAQIEAALRRIAEGGYGYCVTCDEKIAVKRLEQDPAVPQCIKCARGTERP